MELTDSSAKIEEPAAKTPMKKGRAKKWLWRGVLVIGVIIAAYYLVPPVRYFLFHESTDDAYVTGRITPISAEIKGRVVNVFVRDNQRVKAGEPLFEIFSEDYYKMVMEKEESRSALLAQKAEVAASIEEKKKAVVQARANLAAALADEKLAAKELARYQGLLKEQLVAQSQYDGVEAQWKVAVAHRDASRAAIAEAEASLATFYARLKTQDPLIKESESSLDLAKLDLKRTMVMAPVSGRIAGKNVDPGQYVQAGQPLLSLVDDRDIWIVANYKETQIGKMRIGQPVDIQVDSYPGITFNGHIDSFQSGTGAVFSLLPPENATGNFVKVVQRIPVKIVLDSPPDPNHPLWPGMSVVPHVDVRIRKGGAYAPAPLKK